MEFFPSALFSGLLAVGPTAGPLSRQAPTLAGRFRCCKFTLLIVVTRKFARESMLGRRAECEIASQRTPQF